MLHVAVFKQSKLYNSVQCGVSHTHTHTHTDHSHQEQFEFQYLDQGHFDMWTADMQTLGLVDDCSQQLNETMTCSEFTDWHMLRDVATSESHDNLDDSTSSVTSYFSKCVDDVWITMSWSDCICVLCVFMGFAVSLQFGLFTSCIPVFLHSLPILSYFCPASDSLAR